MSRGWVRWAARVGGMALGALLLVWAAGLGAHLLSARSALRHVDSLVADGIGSLLGSPVRLAELQTALVDLSAELEAVELWAGPALFLAPRLGWLPGVGAELAAAPELLTLGQALALGGTQALEAAMPIVRELALGEAGQDGWGAVLGAGLAAARPHLDSAEASLAKASRLREKLDAERLSASLAELLARLDRYLPPLLTAVRGGQAAPTLLGMDGPRTYLLLAQNNHELRATGGFISGVGQVTLHQGRIEDARFADSYAVDNLSVPHPPPPDALARTMGAEMWLLRDANWSPDFPTSARVAAALYAQDQGVAVDGVIAIDLPGLASLLGGLGTIYVPGYPEPVSASTAEALVMRYWTAPTALPPGATSADWLAHRKDILVDLFGAAIEHVAGSGELDLAALLSGLRWALEEKHLLLYAEDGAAQALLRQANWDGALQEPDGADFLVVVDSNVGFNKVNPNVEQWIDYRVDLSGDRPAATLTLTYRHRVVRPAEACVRAAAAETNYRDLMEQCYWDYLRIYVPAGSGLIAAQGCDEPVEVWDELGRTVLGCAFVLPVAQARQLVLEYVLPASVGDGGYRLHLHKQSGTPALPVRVQVIPPEGAGVPSPATGALLVEGTWVWAGALARDLDLVLPGLER